MKNKKQLFEALVAGDNLKDIKIFRPILMHFAARFSGKTYGEFASDYRVLVESNMKCAEHFDLDMVGLISDPYRETAAFGAKVEFQDEAVPICRELIVQTEDDVKQLKNPDVYKSGRTLDRIRGAEYFRKLLNGTMPVIGWIEGPLAEACDLAGISQMLMQLMMDSGFSNRLLDKCNVTAKDFAKAQIEAGCDIIGIGDAICSQIDRATYDTFVKSRHKGIIDFIHSLGALVKLHICGNITHLLPSLKDVGADIVDLDWQVGFDHAYNVLGDEVVLGGNINPVLVESLSKEDVYDMTQALLQNVQGKKHILSAGCEISVLTPPENLMAMREALR